MEYFILGILFGTLGIRIIDFFSNLTIGLEELIKSIISVKIVSNNSIIETMQFDNDGISNNEFKIKGFMKEKEGDEENASQT